MTNLYLHYNKKHTNLDTFSFLFMCYNNCNKYQAGFIICYKHKILVEKLYISLTNRINKSHKMITISYWFPVKFVDLHWILPMISKWLTILIISWTNPVCIHYLRITVAEKKTVNPFKWVLKFIINTEKSFIKTFHLENWNKELQNKLLLAAMMEK